jgi:sec-independent protein translocase protein TatC
MTVVEHLVELRHRIIVCLLGIAVGALIAFVFFPQILRLMERPLKSVLPPEDARLIITGPLEGFAVRLKVAAYGGLILASPVVLWQTWRFITPGLYGREKKFAIPFVVSSLVLFAAGGAVAIITLKPALNFLLKVGGTGLRPLLKVNDYLTLIFLMIVAFGISFEFPLLLVFLLIARVVTTQQLSRWRRGMAVGIVAFAAVITPSQDPISLFAMAVPLYLLFETAIVIGKVLKR